MNLITGIIKQDIKLAFKKGGGIGNMLAFYLMVSVLFVFGIGSDPKNTVFIAPSVIWVCALLVQVITVSRIFADDYEDGTLEQLILQGGLLEKIVMARMVSNWLTSGLILILFSPVVAILFGLDSHLIYMLLLSLICGTPLLSIISVAVASLTIGIRKSGVIFGILAFPLYIPVLIFGSSWVKSQDMFLSHMALLLSILLFMLPLLVLASVVAIKTAFEEG